MHGTASLPGYFPLLRSTFETLPSGANVTNAWPAPKAVDVPHELRSTRPTADAAAVRSKDAPEAAIFPAAVAVDAGCSVAAGAAGMGTVAAVVAGTTEAAAATGDACSEPGWTTAAGTGADGGGVLAYLAPGTSVPFRFSGRSNAPTSATERVWPFVKFLYAYYWTKTPRKVT